MHTLRDKALNYLARREHSRLELKQKLLAKNFSLSEIEALLDELIANHSQSDERFAHAYVRYRKQAGFGPKRIELELRERGVVDAIIANAVDIQSPEWQTQITAIWQRKFTHPPKNQSEKAQQFRFLSYRGYNSETIIQLITRQGDARVSKRD